MLHTTFSFPNPTEADVLDYGLHLLNQLLQESGHNLNDFPPMPLPTQRWAVTSENKFILEHIRLQRDAQQVDSEINIGKLNVAQNVAYTSISSSVLNDRGTTFFVSGGVGTGKTFLYNTVATKIRSLGHIIVIVASSGIASLLLIGGRTAHSTFSIPINILENSLCGFTKQELKVGVPVMLLRNIAPEDGLCNGTRLIIVRCGIRVIECRILTGDKEGNLVFIPRISLTPSSSDLPFRMSRRQFPLRLAYAVTINKSQGQSVKIVGVDLRTLVFSHGQLYVAFSRCTYFDGVTVLAPEDGSTSTSNIVYPEVLL